MNIAKVGPLQSEPDMMEHSFSCVSCLANASYKFPKKAATK